MAGFSFSFALFVLLSSSFSLFAGAHRRKQNQSFEIPVSGESSMGNAVIEFGEPPQTVLLLPDTGSSETWIFCKKFPGASETLNFSGYYDIAASSTFKPVYCYSPVCKDLEECSSPSDLCHFNLSYADGTLIRGFWAKETVTLISDAGEKIKFENFTVGCGFPVSGDVEAATGVLGLSPEGRSFASYMNSELGGASMAHYVPRDSRDGFLLFGDASTFSDTGEGMDYIDFLASSSFVGIAGVFVGGEEISAPSRIWDFDPETNSGGVILDTGTPLTYLAEEVFYGVLTEYGEYFREVGSPWWEREGEFCFAAMGYEPENFPAMEIEFEGGARLTPFKENLVYELEDGILCLTVKAGNRSEGFIIGSYFLKGLYWVYDPDRLRVGFRA